MKLFAVIIILLISINLKSQDFVGEIIQQDSIYKVNNVKARIHDNPENLSLLPNYIYFDKEGRIVELRLEDFHKSKPTERIIKEYNNGILIAEDYFYGSIIGEKTEFEYDSKNRIIKKSTRYYTDTIKNEIIFLYDPYSETKKTYDKKGLLTSISTSTFERQKTLKTYSWIEYSANGKIKGKYKNIYKNNFDENNQLIQTIWIQSGRQIGIYEYVYNEAGLLIKVECSIIGMPKSIILYNYQYWE